MEIFKKPNMKGYKTFDKSFGLYGYQFKENAVFEEEEAEVYKSSFFFYKNPFDIPLAYLYGEKLGFAEVEALGRCFTDDYKEYYTNKIHIGENVGINGFIQCAIDSLKEKADDRAILNSEEYGKVATNRNYSQIAASGMYSQTAASGNCSKIFANGRNSSVAASGDYVDIATSGIFSSVAASGCDLDIVTSGADTQVATSGDCVNISTSGDNSTVSTSGESTEITIIGDCSSAVTNGEESRITINGANSVGVNIGQGGMIKGEIGSWITLAEYEWDEEKKKDICVCVKTAQIDGILLKPDIWYILKNGQFVEYFDIDDLPYDEFLKYIEDEEYEDEE